MKAALLVVVGAILFSGCAFGRKHVYNAGQPRLAHRGSNTPIALAVHDQRPNVVNGTKAPTFVGFSRGGYGNRFDIVTKSGRPLAQDFADTIGRALTANNYSVTHVLAEPHHPVQAVVSALMRTGAPRALLVRIDEWMSDTYINTALEYKMTARALGPGGVAMGETYVSGRDSLGETSGTRQVTRKRRCRPLTSTDWRGCSTGPKLGEHSSFLPPRLPQCRPLLPLRQRPFLHRSPGRRDRYRRQVRSVGRRSRSDVGRSKQSRWLICSACAGPVYVPRFFRRRWWQRWQPRRSHW